MTGPEARHLVVGRLRRPHGLKGECAVFPLTNQPAEVFAVGRRVWVKEMSGTLVAGPLTIDRSRPYHREWLVGFAGHDRREAIEPIAGLFLAAPAAELAPPAEGEVYLHELEGFAVRDGAGDALGLVSGVFDLPAGITLEVQGPRREWLLPFRKEFVKDVDRAGRVMRVELPDGFTEQ